MGVLRQQLRLMMLLQLASLLTVASTAAERLWSLPEAAAFLGVPVATLYKWASERTGPRSYRVGRFRKYRESDVLAWLDKQASDNATEGK